MNHTTRHEGVQYAKKSDCGKQILAIKKAERVRRLQRVTKVSSVLLAKTLALAATHST
jgi:hypothetical protein